MPLDRAVIPQVAKEEAPSALHDKFGQYPSPKAPRNSGSKGMGNGQGPAEEGEAHTIFYTDHLFCFQVSRPPAMFLEQNKFQQHNFAFTELGFELTPECM